MKIEFGVQEYFDELKLMDAQYGQEEELYPWIYMLLQMAESRKGDDHERLSIRDVHNLKRYNWLDGSTRGEMLYRVREKLGAPDFIILDSEMKQFCGCVEMKTLNSTLKMQKPKKDAVKNKNTNYASSIMNVSQPAIKDSLVSFAYSDYISVFLFIELCTSSDNVYKRTADVIQTTMAQNDSEFVLSKSLTYYTIETKVRVKPMMMTLPYAQQSGVTVTDTDTWNTFEYKTSKGY